MPEPGTEEEREFRRALVVNSVFGTLLRPGLMREQAERWRRVRGIVEEARRRPWTRTYAMAEFLGEAERVAVLAERRAADDRNANRSVTDPAFAEARAFNAAVAVLDFARKLALPGFLLDPAPEGMPERFAPVALRRAKAGEAAVPLAAGGVPVPGWAAAGHGERTERFAVVNLDNREVLGVLRSAGNASGLARALGLPALRFLGEEGMRRYEADFLLKGRTAPLADPERPVPAMHPLEHEIFCGRLRRRREGDGEEYMTPGEGLRAARAKGELADALRESRLLEEALRREGPGAPSGLWRRKYRPITFDMLPEDMRLGSLGRRLDDGRYLLPGCSELPPVEPVGVKTPGGRVRVRGLPVVSEDPVLALVQRRALETLRTGRQPMWVAGASAAATVQEKAQAQVQTQDRGQGQGQAETQDREQVLAKGREQVLAKGREQVQARDREQVQAQDRGQGLAETQDREQVQAQGREQVQAQGREQVQTKDREQFQRKDREQAKEHEHDQGQGQTQEQVQAQEQAQARAQESPGADVSPGTFRGDGKEAGQSIAALSRMSGEAHEAARIVAGPDPDPDDGGPAAPGEAVSVRSVTENGVKAAACKESAHGPSATAGEGFRAGDGRQEAQGRPAFSRESCSVSRASVRESRSFQDAVMRVGFLVAGGRQGPRGPVASVREAGSVPAASVRDGLPAGAGGQARQAGVRPEAVENILQTPELTKTVHGRPAASVKDVPDFSGRVTPPRNVVRPASIPSRKDAREVPSGPGAASPGESRGPGMGP
jgi:hypothetical protein